MNKPLAGIRIADFSHVMAGPYASHLLRLMGAEVIKIEPPTGDSFRSYNVDPRFEGMSPAFIAANAGDNIAGAHIIGQALSDFY